MKWIFTLFFCVGICSFLSAQEIDSDLLLIKQRMDSIHNFTADLQLHVDISFVNMPDKSAKMSYKKGEPTKFSSEDFALIPKRGLDFSLEELFAHPIITVDRGTQNRNGKTYKMINVIPTDKKADFSIATLLLDTQNRRIVESEVNTRKNGSYAMSFSYEDPQKALPNMVEVGFEIEKIKIPLSFMAKDSEVDRAQLKSDTLKTGKIFLRLSNYEIWYSDGDKM